MISPLPVLHEQTYSIDCLCIEVHENCVEFVGYIMLCFLWLVTNCKLQLSFLNICTYWVISFFCCMTLSLLFLC